MINIKLSDKYSITSDTRQYILNEHRIVQEGGKNEGEEYIVGVAYCSTLASLLKTYKERVIRVSNVETLDDLINIVENTDKHIDEVLKEVVR